ncbi:Uncharacterized protein MLTONO_1449 [Mesorhizobium loti]|nr:Uncharacterized protein MLTONO_1449 [Mesorhizobium loti]
MATISATRRALVAVSGKASVSGMAVMSVWFEQHLAGSVQTQRNKLSCHAAACYGMSGVTEESTRIK